MICQYVRDKDGRFVGVLVGVALTLDGSYSIGWSKCNLKKDKFDKKTALKIARERALVVATRSVRAEKEGKIAKCTVLPRLIGEYFDKFKARCNRYFKIAAWNPNQCLGSVQNQNFNRRLN